MKEVAGVEFRRNGVKGTRRSPREESRQIVRIDIGVCSRTDRAEGCSLRAEVLLDELENASKIMIGIVDVPGPSVGGHYHQRNAEPIDISSAPVVALADAVGRDMVVPDTPIVPGDEDSGVLPVDFAGFVAGVVAADGVHDGSDPRWSAAIGAASMVGLRSVG